MAQSNPRGRRWRRWLVFFLIVLVAFWVVRAWFAPTVPEGSWVLVDLSGDFLEEPPDSVIGSLVREQRMTLLQVIDAIRDSARDDRVAGLVVRVRPLQIGWAKAQDIRDALLEFRGSEKPLIAYLEQELVSGTLEYYVASAAQTIYLPPAASAPLTGLLAQYMFFGQVWQKLEIEMQVERIGKYKTAADTIAGESMTPEFREMANWLLDSIYGQVVSGIGGGRNLQEEAVRAAIDRAPITAAELAELGLLDGVKTLEEIRTEQLGTDEDFLKAEDYAKAGGLPAATETLGKIAVVYGIGAITTGESRGGALDGGTMGSDTLVEAFDEAAEDSEAKAIVFRVDSPGGSALASDLIWQSVQRAAARKPVLVSMSDVAASGGYYVSAGASRIFAQPGTLTGSIGVVLMKPNLRGFLSSLGIHTETVSRGERAGMTSLVTSLSPQQLERIRTAMDEVYGLFLERVAAGREELSREQVDAIGRGRVWTGAQAKERGLVDELGGFIAAIQAAKAAVGIAPDEQVELVFYPKPKPLLARLGELFGAEVAERMPSWWRALQGRLSFFELADGGILTLMPEEIVIR